MTDAQLQRLQKPESTTDACLEYERDGVWTRLCRKAEQVSAGVKTITGLGPMIKWKHKTRVKKMMVLTVSSLLIQLSLMLNERGRKSGRYVWEDHSPQSGFFKVTNGGEVIFFSGCDDDQSYADTVALSKVTSTGAMTFLFIQAIERGHATTYGDMLTSMRTTIRNNESDMGGDAVTSLLGMLLTGGSLGGGIRQVSSSLREIFLLHYCAGQNEWVGLTHKYIPLLIENLVD
ncbi:putative metacaspase type I, plant [Helianthus anomalus]